VCSSDLPKTPKPQNPSNIGDKAIYKNKEAHIG